MIGPWFAQVLELLGHHIALSDGLRPAFLAVSLLIALSAALSFSLTLDLVEATARSGGKA